MTDFISKHFKFILVIAGLIILLLVLFLLWTSNRNNSPSVANSTNEFISDYEFLDSDISQDDKFLLLSGTLVAEAYSTFENGDVQGLLDIQNQSTDKVIAQVQRRINSFNSKGASYNIRTTALPETLKISWVDESTAEVNMNTETIEGNSQASRTEVTVRFIYQNNFWLVDEILLRDL